MQTNTPKISVIVPVYNAEKWLRRCVDSILAQTYTDFELLLIDDGSTDDSGAICDEYATIDQRIRVFHKPNGGVSSARNLGLDNAVGEWISFVDSDDWMAKEHLGDLMKYLQYDFRANEYRCNNDEQQHEVLPDKNYDTKAEIGECISEFFNLHLRMPWGKRYRADIIREHNIRFNTMITIGEDLIFNLEYLCYVHSISLSSYSGIIYNRDNENSLTHRPDKYTPELFMAETHRQIEALENKWNRDFRELLIDLCLFDFCLAIERIATVRSCRREKKKYLKELMIISPCSMIINDQHLLSKGRRRKVIDFLLKNKLYLLAVKTIERYPNY